MGVPCRCHTGKAAHFCGDPPAGTDGVCWWNARDGRPNLPARKTNMGTAQHVETAHSRDKSFSSGRCDVPHSVQAETSHVTPPWSQLLRVLCIGSCIL